MKYQKIECVKNDRTLIELQAALIPASKGEIGRLLDSKSKIKILLSDYSKGKGASNVFVQANISCEECQQVFEDAKFFHHFKIKNKYDLKQVKVFGTYYDENKQETDQNIVTKLSIQRIAVDKQGNEMRNPWIITIENGKGKMVEGRNQLDQSSYTCLKRVSKQLNDFDMIRLFRRADALIKSAELSVFENNKNDLFTSTYKENK